MITRAMKRSRGSEGLEAHSLTERPKQRKTKYAECCHLCGEKYTKNSEEHDGVCSKKLIPCPNQKNGCPTSTERGQAKEHTSVCGYIVVPCTYESLGCGVRMLRKDTEKHKREAREKHMDLALDTVSSREEQHKTLSEGEALVFKVPGYASKKENDERFYSVPFYTHPGGYKMFIIVDANGNGEGLGSHLSVFAQLIEGRYDDHVKWPFTGIVEFELLNQLSDVNHFRKFCYFPAHEDLQIGIDIGKNLFIPHSSLCHDPATNTQYLLDDTLYFRVSVKVDNHKPWLVCTDKVNLSKQYPSSNKASKCVKMVKATGYKAMKESNGWYFADPFYTHTGGYSMRIAIACNGGSFCKGTHVSVFARFLEGAYDASLSWPFLGTVTFTLLNQLSDENHYSMTLRYEANNSFGRAHKNYGYVNFIPQAGLCHDPAKNIQYLKDDTLYFRVSITVRDFKPWLVCTSSCAS